MDSITKVLLILLGFFMTQECWTAQVEVNPREVLVLPRQNVSVVCRVGVPLQYCRVEIPGLKPLNLKQGAVTQDVSYYGAGLPAGQCGFTIHNVNDLNNGPARCTLGLDGDYEESVGVAQIIVARQPKLPELDLSRGTDSLRVYKINDLLQASCIVKDGRPVANISWYLDDEPLYREGLSMPTVIDMAKENLQSKLQNLTRILQASDNGKHLRCVAFHPAYPDGRAETQRQLDVKYAPLPQGELDKFGYTLNEPGVISVTIESNPKPQIEWEIGTETIKEGDGDQTGRIKTEVARDLGNGRYEVNMKLARIYKHDTENPFYLRAYNDLGRQMYTIKISTSPEPEGIELGVGGIIGIIVGVLVLLLLVFVLVFAAVTKRWCFSGYRDTKTLGETSDTESADVRPKDHRNFPIKLTSFFRKTKDRLPEDEDPEDASKQPEDDARPEEGGELPKKAGGDETKEGGIVYAELDLVSPAANLKPVVKNDDEKTEYAEIVYTPNETEQKSTTT